MKETQMIPIYLSWLIWLQIKFQYIRYATLLFSFKSNISVGQSITVPVSLDDQMKMIDGLSYITTERLCLMVTVMVQMLDRKV